MSMTYEFLFQIINTVLFITIPIIIYSLVKRFIIRMKLTDKKISDLEDKLYNAEKR